MVSNLSEFGVPKPVTGSHPRRGIPERPGYNGRASRLRLLISGVDAVASHAVSRRYVIHVIQRLGPDRVQQRVEPARPRLAVRAGARR